ncbi:MAG: TetR/AcrR family transcriptional regulator [Clostridia bacterium]|nr:TetR/AcrR family transcriptional regulator [Clostridia bacterium]
MDRRVERTKRNIYLAFFELMKKKAMDDISITELAAAADIDRRTFYKHYATVIDVYNEYKQQLQDQLLQNLNECERPDGALDYEEFFRRLETIMESQLPFFQKLSSDQASMFLRYDCKDILESAFRDFYKDRFPGTREELDVYIAGLSYAITGLGSDFLNRKPGLSFEEYFGLLVPHLQKLWVPRT